MRRQRAKTQNAETIPVVSHRHIHIKRSWIANSRTVSGTRRTRLCGNGHPDTKYEKDSNKENISREMEEHCSPKQC